MAAPEHEYKRGGHLPKPGLQEAVCHPQSWLGGTFEMGKGTEGGQPSERQCVPRLGVWRFRASFQALTSPRNHPPAAFRDPELDKGHWLLIAALSAVLGLADKRGVPGCVPVAVVVSLS